jgi:hypothetical protein
VISGIAMLPNSRKQIKLRQRCRLSNAGVLSPTDMLYQTALTVAASVVDDRVVTRVDFAGLL